MKKPWNRVDLPVYSISSRDAQSNVNMNIITYASAVSMKPKLYVCGIYYNTRTLENVQRNGRFALQLLSADQYNLVRVLGKKSGLSFDKNAWLSKRDLISEWNGYLVLSNALALMEMEATPLATPSTSKPDHQLFLCNVTAYKNLNAGLPLTLDILRMRKIVRM